MLTGLCFTWSVWSLSAIVKWLSKIKMVILHVASIGKQLFSLLKELVVRGLSRMHLKWWIVSRCSSPLQTAINLEPAWARDKSFVQWTKLLLTITHSWLSLSWVDGNMSFFPPGKLLELPFMEQKKLRGTYPKSLPLTTFNKGENSKVDQISVKLFNARKGEWRNEPQVAMPGYRGR